MKRIIATGIVVIAATAAFAQQPYVYFNRITTEKGLSHNKVNCILQDKRGFMWLGTEDGLNRYDGQYFTVFRNKPNDTSTISGNIIADLLEDEDSVLWIATTDGGLTKYDYRLPSKKQFKQFKHIAGDSTTIPVNIINKLVEDKQGYLWLATSGNFVLRFNKKTETFESPVKKGTSTVACLCIDDKGILWAGKIGGSFLKINTVTLQYETDERYNDLYPKKQLPHATITSLYRDNENNIWYGSWDNVLYNYNTKTKQEKIFKQDASAFSFPNDEVQSFAADNTGRMWMAGKYYGLTIYDKKQNKFFNFRYNPLQEGSIADNRVNYVYIDRSGLVWIATNRGLCISNPLQEYFEQTFLPQQKKEMTIYDFYEDEQHSLWIGTSEGIFLRSAGSDEFELKKLFFKGEQLAVTKFFKDVDGTLYIGTNYSLFVYHPAINTISILPNTEKDLVMKKIIDSRVVSVMRDTIENHPVLLVSPYGHYITYYDLVEKKWVSRRDSVKNIVYNFNLKDNLIRKFYRADNAHVWIATAKYGLGEWQKHSLPRVDHLCNNPKVEKTISNDNVYDMLEDTKGNLWVSTYGGGLNYFNTITKGFRHIATTNNLLEGIQTDLYGNVWMISNGSLQKYDPHRESFTSYTLPDLEKTGGVKGYIYKDSKNDLYIAGNNYFIKFNPLLIKEIKKQPKVFLTDFKIFNQSKSDLLGKKNIELRYFQNYFSIEFSAPEFRGPVEYSFMLRGLDKDWTDAGNRNFANFSNLSGGTYTFQVRASNKKGSWGSEVTSVTITIIPPFWQQWWFYIVCSVTVVSAVYLLYRYRINELLKRQAIRNKIAQDLHDNLGSTLSSISVYSKVANIYNQQQKHEQLQQTLEKIGETSGDMITEMGDIVWAINPKNDHMNTIIQRMESYARPLLQAKDIQFNFTYDPAIPALNLQMDKRKNFYLIFKEAINNVIKYSNCKAVHVSIHLHNQKIELKVTDNGEGFEMKKIQSITSKSLSGNGLKNMHLRAKEMKAVFTIESEPGKGTALFLAVNIP